MASKMLQGESGAALKLPALPFMAFSTQKSTDILDFLTGCGSLVNVPTPEISSHFWHADNLCFWANKTMGQAPRWCQEAVT